MFIRDDTVKVMGGRSGTVEATEAELIGLWGEPNRKPSGDGKVTMTWRFSNSDDPSRPFEVRDYWWNPPGQWSIAGFPLMPAELTGDGDDKAAARKQWHADNEVQQARFLVWLKGLGLTVCER